MDIKIPLSFTLDDGDDYDGAEVCYKDEVESYCNRVMKEYNNFKESHKRATKAIDELYADVKRMSNTIVVRTHNFGKSGEIPGMDEEIICYCDSAEKGKTIASFLNSRERENSQDYYTIETFGYKLKVFEP